MNIDFSNPEVKKNLLFIPLGIILLLISLYIFGAIRKKEQKPINIVSQTPEATINSKKIINISSDGRLIQYQDLKGDIIIESTDIEISKEKAGEILGIPKEKSFFYFIPAASSKQGLTPEPTLNPVITDFDYKKWGLEENNAD